MNHTCVCSDKGCSACEGLCEDRATFTLYRIDMDDRSGSRFCEGCASDAMDSGVFTDEPMSDDDEPGEEDYTLSDCGRLGANTAVGIVGSRFHSVFATDDEALDFIRERMEKVQFWPNVWRISDHGNAHRIDVSAKAVQS